MDAPIVLKGEIVEEAPDKLKRAQTPATPEDYEFPKETDPDFPKSDPHSPAIPAVKGAFKLPANVIPEKKQAERLNWPLKTIRVVNEETGIYFQGPSICAGTMGCPYGSICPVSNRDDFIGENCPLELKELFKYFTGYIRDLNIEPDVYTELRLVADLCRQELILWRTDMHMKLETEVLEEVGVVDQKSGTAHNRRVLNKHREAQKEARAAIHQIYKQLVATRAERNAQNKDSDRTNSLSVVLSQLGK